MLFGAEDAGPGGVDARAEHLAGLHQVLVGEHVGGGGLRIAHGRHAVGEVGGVPPHLVAVHAQLAAHVRVRVDESRR